MFFAALDRYFVITDLMATCVITTLTRGPFVPFSICPSLLPVFLNTLPSARVPFGAVIIFLRRHLLLDGFTCGLIVSQRCIMR